MKPGMRLYGTIVNHTLNNIVAYANQIYDESKDKFQSDINSGLQTSIVQEINDRLAGDQVLLDAIDLLNANSSTQGSVQYWIKQAIDAVVADAPEAFDTLKEIADWIAQDEHGTAALINRVATNERAIATINTAISELLLAVESDAQELHLFKIEIRNEVEQGILNAVNDAKVREQEIWTDVSRVDGRVTTVSNKVNDITDENGNIKYTQALQSVIDTGISNNQAFNNISSRWAVVSENQLVLEWMAAGFKSQVSPSTSFALVYAAANQSTSNAISNLTTTVNNLGDTYVAKARLKTEVESIVKNDIGIQSFSEIALDSDVSAAEARMVSKYTTLNNEVGTLSTSLSGVSIKADANAAKLAALATWDGNTPTGYKYTSGLVTESNKDSAIASLFAQGTSSTSKSNIMALITAEVQGEVSSLTLTADKIYLNANETLANTIRATQGTIGGFTISSDSISYGDLVSGQFSIIADETNGPELSIIRSAGLEEHHGAVLNESGLKFYSNYRRLHQYVETNKINLDGSGSLACGHFTWDSNGNINVIGDGSSTVQIGLIREWEEGDINKKYTISLNNGGFVAEYKDDDYGYAKIHVDPWGVRFYDDELRNVNIVQDESGLRITGGSIIVNNQEGYVIQGYSDDYVLLAGGGTKALSEFPSGGGNYLPLTGGTMTGSINFMSSAAGINFSDGSQAIGDISWNSLYEGLSLHSNRKIVLECSTIWAEGDLTATSFIKDGGTSSQFLKADGSVTTLKTINGNSLEGSGNIVISGGSGNYLPITGGTLTGDLYIEDIKNINILINQSSLAASVLRLGYDGNDTVLKFYVGGYGSELNMASITTEGYFVGQGFQKDGGTSSQFLKADGSVDSNSYLPLTGGTMNGVINFTSSLYGINFSDDDPNKMGTISWDPDINGLHVIAYGRICLDTQGNDVWAEGPLSVSGSATATAFIQSSDETLKNKVADVELTAEQIADAPSIKFTWKDENKSQEVNVGTIAQYWQEVLPEVIGKDKNDKLTMNYPALATVSVISLAKEVVELKSKIKELENRS